MLSAARFALGVTAVLHAAALGQSSTRPDATTAGPGRTVEGPAVTAAPGFAGRWTVQQWAPLRLVLGDPGPVETVELFCVEAGPTFRAAGVPAATGQSVLDLAVYAQVPSNKWTVRLAGRAIRREIPIDLGVEFRGYRPD